jgi:hypothetical protein
MKIRREKHLEAAFGVNSTEMVKINVGIKETTLFGADSCDYFFQKKSDGT